MRVHRLALLGDRQIEGASCCQLLRQLMSAVAASLVFFGQASPRSLAETEVSAFIFCLLVCIEALACLAVYINQ